jgi:hypothetical protein
MQARTTSGGQYSSIRESGLAQEGPGHRSTLRIRDNAISREGEDAITTGRDNALSRHLLIATTRQSDIERYLLFLAISRQRDVGVSA